MPQLRATALVFFALLAQLASVKAVDIEVPARMKYCGLDLTIDQAARTKIGEVIQLHTRYPTGFQALVDKAGSYLPIVEEALLYAEVPTDLQYIVIQESSFQADVVSSSGAVGFWQFKEASAREVGLAINSQIDERMHIFRSSVGAGRYFFRINRDFDNWLYAVIAYNRGPVGALAFVNEKYYHAKAMPVTGDMHPYALKALAFKLMFQDVKSNARPNSWLEPHSTQGETSIAKLAQRHDLDVATLKQHNKWMRGSELPAQAEGASYIYYIPHTGAPVLAQMRHVTDGLDRPQIGSKEPVSVTPPKPVTQPRNDRKFTYLSPAEDPSVGVDYLIVEEGENLVELAVASGMNTKKLRALNGFDAAHRVQAGEVVYLKAPKKRRYHIVRPGEDLNDIAELYVTTREKLQEKNNLSDAKVLPGQKLSLKKTTPKGEKPILLDATIPDAPVKAAPSKPAPSPKAEVKSEVKTEVKPTQPKSGGSSGGNASSGSTKTHTVASGDTLWNIAKRYNTTVSAIQQLNQMRSESVYIGQKLKIPAGK
jgi:membrane-bound lytic murein transglycosylase D